MMPWIVAAIALTTCAIGAITGWLDRELVALIMGATAIWLVITARD